MLKIYKDIRKELALYGQGLDKKKEIIILTKSDVADKKIVAKRVAEFKKIRTQVFTLTLYDDASVKKLRDKLVKILEK